MFAWLKKNAKNLLLAASAVVHVLGYTGVIPNAAANKAGQVIDAVGNSTK